jgi:UDPglucose 6-dehydrogenase
VVGSGHVALVAGACLSESGNDLVCCNIDEGKIRRLNAGEIPICEPGLELLVAHRPEPRQETDRYLADLVGPG